MEQQRQRTVDANLVARIAGGDRDAEIEFVRRFMRALKMMLWLRCRDPDITDDLLQETLRTLIERLRSNALRDAYRLPAYIHKTAHHVWLGYQRKEHRRNTWPDIEAIVSHPSPAETQLDALLRAEEARLIRRLLDELGNARDREILLRFYILEQDKALICTDLDLTFSNFDRVMYRAKRRFRQLVEQRSRARDD